MNAQVFVPMSTTNSDMIRSQNIRTL